MLNSGNLFLDPKARHWEAVSREWELDKARILSAVAGGGGADMAELSLAREVSTVSRIHDSTLAGASSLSQSELSYARAVVDYNTAVAGGGLRPDLLATFASLFSEEKDPEVWGLWEMATAMASLPKERPAAEVVKRARSNLEAAYSKFLRQTVFDNLASAQLGGLPGTLPLVRSFLNLRVPASTPGLDDGLVDGAPVWAMIYFCLRCGDLAAALQAAQKAGPGLADAQSLLQELITAPDCRLSPQTEGAVRLQYRRSVRQSTDPYKRAVYCVVAACDPTEEHTEVATSLDDYLWLKLCCLREEGGDTLTLPGLQTLLTEEYGESHFNATAQPLLYFQVLQKTVIPSTFTCMHCRSCSSLDNLRPLWSSCSGPGNSSPAMLSTLPLPSLSWAFSACLPASSHLCSVERPATKFLAAESTLLAS